MRALDRLNEPISLELAVGGTRLELRIHGAAPEGDRYTYLTAKEARVLAYRLLAEAETVTAKKDG